MKGARNGDIRKSKAVLVPMGIIKEGQRVKEQGCDEMNCWMKRK